jgi:hypothetical protein
MTITTVEPPKYPPLEKRTFRLRCNTPRCEALLQMDFSDLKLSPTDPRDHGPVCFEWKCPHCQKTSYINKINLENSPLTFGMDK